MKAIGEDQLSPVQVRNLFGGNIPTAQVLQGVASGLAGVGIRVEISPAIKVPCADTKNKIIYLPSMIKSKKALLVVKMLTDHEGGHIIYTPEDMVEMIDSVVNHGDIHKYCTEKLEMGKVPVPLWNYAKSFWNCVEDPRIEKLMIRAFPGCKHHFIAGTIASGCDTLVTDTINKHVEGVEEAEEQGLPEEAYPKLNPFWLAEWHAFHRVGGSHGQESRDHVKEATPEGYEWVFEIVENNLVGTEEDITKVESIDLVRVADKTIAEIMEYLKLEKPPEDKGGGGQGKQQNEKQGGKPGQGNQGPSPEDNNENNPSNGKMGDESESGEGSSGEGGDEEAGESGEKSSGNDKGDSGDDSGKGKGSGEEDEDSDDGDAGGDSKGDGSDSGSDDDASGQSDNSNESDDGDGDSVDGDDGKNGNTNGDEEGSEGRSGEDEDDDADALENESGGKGNPKWDQAVEWLKEAQVDLAEEIKKGLEAAEAGTEETTEDDGGSVSQGNGQPGSGSPAKYVGEEDLEGMPEEYLTKIRPGMRVLVIGSQDIGKIVDGQHKASFDAYNQGIRELMPKNLGAASKKLMGEFRASFGPADKGSRLNPRMFTSIHTGKWQGKKVMLARNKTRLSKRGVCVQLVIDCSGSMVEGIYGLNMGNYNSKFAVAHASARGLSRLLQGIGVSFEVVGFSTAYNRSPGTAPGASGSGGSYSHNPYGDESRTVDIVNYVFKEFQAPWAVSEKTMLAINPSTNFDLPDGTNICPHTNSDGESILWAATRIIGRKEEKKIMIVLSDGLPYAGSMRLQSSFLKWAVRRVENSGIHIGGLGLGSTGVNQYYTNYEIIDEFPQGKGEKYSAPLFIQNKIISLINKMSHE